MQVLVQSWYIYIYIIPSIHLQSTLPSFPPPSLPPLNYVFIYSQFRIRMFFLKSIVKSMFFYNIIGNISLHFPLEFWSLGSIILAISSWTFHQLFNTETFCGYLIFIFDVILETCLRNTWHNCCVLCTWKIRLQLLIGCKCPIIWNK